MLAGISTLCFGASYAVAFALELSRLWFRSGVRGALLIAFAAAGLLAHTLFLGYRAATATSTPISSPFDWFLVAAWVLAATYLYLTYYHPRTAVGLFILPLVLALVGVAQFFASHEPFAETRASQIWGAIHGVFILLGTVAVMVGFVAGVMYLLQSYRLKHKQLAPQGLRLPNLEWLDQINSRAIVISALMLAAGFLSGTVLNLVNHRLEVDELPWSDPVIWTSSLLLVWLATAAVFGVIYKPARQGRKVAYLTVASFLFLVLALGLRLFLPSAHSPARETAPRHESPSLTGRGRGMVALDGLMSEPPSLSGRGQGRVTRDDIMNAAFAIARFDRNSAGDTSAARDLQALTLPSPGGRGLDTKGEGFAGTARHLLTGHVSAHVHAEASA